MQPEEERQQLLSFVTRLAYPDTPVVERKREVYISSRLRDDLPLRARLEILEGALAVGRQADLLEPEEVRTRMTVVQQNDATPTSMADHPMFAKIKSWLASAKNTEPVS